MGQWSLDQVSAGVTPFDTAELFGNNFMVKLSLTYKTSTFGSFVESPKLDWHEKFIMIEHHKQERWVFEKNMYDHNPSSATLLMWPKRYIEAYNSAAGIAKDANLKGITKLFSLKGEPVTKKDLGNAADNKSKADAVRSYLKSKGGRLEVTIHDIPSINIPKGVPGPGSDNKERLLLFNVGLVGGGLRWKGYQHLHVDGRNPKTSWVRSAGADWAKSDLALPQGYKSVEPPVMVSMQRNAAPMAGEYY